jgi:uncharacterized protein (TIGR02453 family)
MVGHPIGAGNVRCRMTFGAGATAWFEGLERDNSRAYFVATRATFEEEVRAPFERLLDGLSGEFGGEVKVFRQHRDVRFSSDKSPYKTRTHGILHSLPGSAAALYAEISAGGLYAASGYWRMASDQLARYRAAVDDDRAGEALEGTVDAVREAGLELAPPALKTVPRGMPRDHPRGELLRYKDLIAGRRLPPGPALGTRAARDHVAATWSAARPLIGWLDEHVGGSG